MATVAKKSSKGRQKVAMVKMAKESNLQVTFSKRRTGLFKKASELCTLCAADVALIVFSPGNKVFSFGHPSVDSIVDRYLSRNRRPQGSSGTMQLIDARRNATIHDLNSHITQVSNQLEVAKKRGDNQMDAMSAERSGCWWRKSVDEMDKAQLEQMRAGLEMLRKKVACQADKILASNNVAQILGNAAPNSVVGFYPSMPGSDPDEFEQKNILGLSLPPPPSHLPMMNMNMNMNMSGSNMTMMNGMHMSNSGYNLHHGSHFDHFQRGFF